VLEWYEVTEYSAMSGSNEEDMKLKIRSIKEFIRIKLKNLLPLIIVKVFCIRLNEIVLFRLGNFE